MFDTTIIRPIETQYIEVEKHVHEHRAPTDKSVELLNEFEEKAKNNILEKVHINNTLIDAIGISFLAGIGNRLTPVNDSDVLEYQVKFKINGTDFIVKDMVKDVKNFNLYETMLNIITKEIMMSVAKELYPFLKTQFGNNYERKIINHL